MLRRSVRALEVLVEQQSAQQSAMLLARNSMAQAGKQVWRRPAARAISSTTRTATRPFQSSSSSSTTLFSRTAPRRTFHSSRARRSQEGKAGEAGKAGAGETGHTVAPEKLSLSQRIKKLSKEYGWTAVGVYFGLSLLDFPFCFLLVRTLGTDRIAAAEEYVVDHVKTVIPESVKERYRKYREALKEAKKESGVDAVKGAVVKATTGSSSSSSSDSEAQTGVAAGERAAAEGIDAIEGQDGWGVKEAERRNKHEASLATQLALAYAIHKSFIFVRVPLAAAVTPKVVKVLRSWGWKIGKPGKPKAA